jgi:hypothetical protein
MFYAQEVPLCSRLFSQKTKKEGWCIDRLREAIVTDVIARHSERFPHLFKERHTMLSLRRSISCGISVKTDTFTEVTEEELAMAPGMSTLQRFAITCSMILFSG